MGTLQSFTSVYVSIGPRSVPAFLIDASEGAAVLGPQGGPPPGQEAGCGLRRCVALLVRPIFPFGCAAQTTLVSALSFACRPAPARRSRREGDSGGTIKGGVLPLRHQGHHLLPDHRTASQRGLHPPCHPHPRHPHNTRAHMGRGVGVRSDPTRLTSPAETHFCFFLMLKIFWSPNLGLKST